MTNCLLYPFERIHQGANDGTSDWLYRKGLRYIESVLVLTRSIASYNLAFRGATLRLGTQEDKENAEEKKWTAEMNMKTKEDRNKTHSTAFSSSTQQPTIQTM